MDNLISKIRHLSLRMWVIISLSLMLFSFLILMALNNYSGLKLYVIFGQLSNLILLVSLAVFAVNSLTKTKTIILIASAGFVISIYGLFDTFNNPWIPYSIAPLDELIEYYTKQATGYMMVQNAAYVVALGIGISSLYERFLIPWIIFMVAYVLSFLIVYLFTIHTFTDNDVVNFNYIVALLSLIGLIILLVKGGKNALSEVQPEANTISSTPLKNASISNSIIDKSKQLFQLKELLDSEVLTKDEFEAEKKKILNID